MSQSRKKFLCLDCHAVTGRIGEHYMLINQTWLAVAEDRNGMLCIGCLEERLGRKLRAADFNDSYLNRSRTAPQSMRLRDRLER